MYLFFIFFNFKNNKNWRRVTPRVACKTIWNLTTKPCLSGHEKEKLEATGETSAHRSHENRLFPFIFLWHILYIEEEKKIKMSFKTCCVWEVVSKTPRQILWSPLSNGTKARSQRSPQNDYLVHYRFRERFVDTVPKVAIVNERHVVVEVFSI